MTAGSILVVDGTPAQRELVAGWLRGGGYAVGEATTGAEALRRLHTEPVDLVVLEVKLPDMSGLDLCERIKSRAPGTPTPVVHMSGTAAEIGDRVPRLVRGADAYLVEPIDRAELLTTVHTVLRYHRELQTAERLAARLARLAQTTRDLHIATDLRQLLRAGASGAAGIFECPAVVAVETPDGVRVAVSCTGPAGVTVMQPFAAEPFEVPFGVVVHDRPAAEWPQLAWPGDQPVRVVGARLRPDRAPVFVGIPASAGDPGAPVHSQLTQAISVALEVLRVYQEEHRVALTLQRSLLPRRLPALPGYDAAVRYVPASAQAEIGGDFYELSTFDHELAVAVGDVAGHSLHAATVMAELRHATRAYLAEGHPPAAVLDRLNSMMMRFIPGEMATMCLLMIELNGGRTRLANAGHPPPLLCHADGRTEFLVHRSPLLGLRAARAADLELTIPPGATLVLYTDGLVERRGDHLDLGLAALARAAARVEDNLEDYCDRLLAEVGPETPDDDIAVVVLRRRS